MGLELLKDFTVEKLHPIIGAKTIQLVVFREILDFAVFRTEDDRELNTVVTPRSVKDTEEVQRVAFLGTKQKAVESRTMERILRTAGEQVLKEGPDSSKLKNWLEKQAECYLKDNLCLNCPRCILFGATSTESGRGRVPNIKHRIEYSTAYSLLPYEEIETSITFNAINDASQSTEQALGTRYAVRPATLFPSIITLKSVTIEELVLTIKTLLAAKSYGAETRIGGDVRNTIIGIAAGWEEIITSLELTLELSADNELVPEQVSRILESYKSYTGNPQKARVFNPEEVEAIVTEAANKEIDLDLLKSLYSQADEYRNKQLKG